MSHAPITDRTEQPDPAEFDAALGVYTLFVEVPRAEVVYFRLVVESWEDYAVPRTAERFLEGDRTRSLVVLLAVPDFIEPCLRRLAILCDEIDGQRVPATPEAQAALRSDLLEPLTAGGQG